MAGNLRRHMKVNGTWKPCRSRVCDKALSLSAHLKLQMRADPCEKPFECAVCSKRFACGGGLVQHSRIHSGEK